MRERDWKIFRELRQVALERFCERILEECVAVSRDAGKSFHERYLELFSLIGDHDDEISLAFDGPSRSRMIMQLRMMRRLDLLNEEELSRFSDECRQQSDPEF